ncbi:MAG: LysR family transcriptional regulator ArgP [Spirochaetales bacterium]|nr:LysR family transcriptional regulator ArgP [Spirochaetales bacterium]
MLEYRYLEALAAVVEQEGFERAGDYLHITQSAVTQRIRQLEELAGQILLIRSQPPVPTEAGLLLLEHFRKVRVLEQEFEARSSLTASKQKPVITLAVNADSLATWFSAVVGRYFSLARGNLDIKSADQDVTHEMMVDGIAMGCISSISTAFRGCRKNLLGNMVYRFVSTRSFAERYFSDGVDEKSYNEAPKLNFNKDDQLLENWAGQFFKNCNSYENSHFMPSSELFPVMVRKGSVCGMLPDEQFNEFKEDYDLVDLSMDKPVSTPLYWHRWSIPSEELDIITEIIMEEAKKALIM